MEKMGKMADMKMGKADKKAMMPTAIGSSSGPDYPWGLQINLDDAALKKLGIKELPDAESPAHIMATGKVTRVSSTSENGETRRSMEIQIMKLNVECTDMDDSKKSKDQVASAYKKASRKSY